MSIRILESQGSTLVQDLGRPGFSSWGVGASGVFDRRAFRHANTLLGNREDAAVIEHAGSNLTLRASRPHAIAITGACGPTSVDGVPVSVGRVIELSAGSVLRLEAPVVGLRYLVAVAGGFEPKPVLGSRSRDTLAELGPQPLTAGSSVPVGLSTAARWSGVINPTLPSGAMTLRVSLGPRDDWFSFDAIARLFTTSWQINSLSSRVGIRLDGPKLERLRHDELASEGVVRGSIQVTNSGLPIILGPDHPVTGGYPVIGVVVDSDTDLLAHARPGDVLHFSRHAI
ncbi:MAG: biotin-dependent carboxyltransferase [Aeromicrobium sp.]|nr:MAG: biotin-dependent carboxyltransferase [Aeromicrobium sp.]